MYAIRECIQKKSVEFIRELRYLDNHVTRSRLKTDKVEFSFRWISFPENPKYGLVSICRSHSYQMLLKEYENIRYMCETVGKGLGIFELDPVSGKSWLLFGTEEYSRLCGASIEDLKEFGVPSVGRYIPDEDRRRAAKYMHQSMCSLTSWTIAPRIYRDGSYRFTRFAGYCTAGDNGTVLSSVIAEDFSDHAREIEKANVEKSASCMLRSFLSAVFDVSFYIDNQYRILDDSSKLEHFLGTRPKGLCLDSFLFSADQSRFSAFMTSRKKQQPTDIASMIRLRLCTGQGMLIDVELFCSPNFIQSVDGLDYSSNVSTVCPSDAGSGTLPVNDGQPTEFLIGLRVICDSSTSTGKLIDSATGYRGLVSDIRASLETAISSIHEWTVPGTDSGVSSDAADIEDCVIRRLSPERQTRFRSHLNDRDHNTLAALLIEADVALDVTVAQLFLNLAKRGSVDDARRIILMLDRWRTKTDAFVLIAICVFYLRLEVDQDTFSEDSIDWSRRFFAQTLKSADTLDDCAELQIIVHYICLLWSCLCKIQQRHEEATAVLEQVLADMNSYIVHYPECNIGKKLELVARHNLAVEFLRTGNVFDALRLSSDISMIAPRPEWERGRSRPFGQVNHI